MTLIEIIAAIIGIAGLSFAITGLAALGYLMFKDILNVH
jgi:hypothetical protein